MKSLHLTAACRLLWQQRMERRQQPLPFRRIKHAFCRSAGLCTRILAETPDFICIQITHHNTSSLHSSEVGGYWFRLPAQVKIRGFEQ